MRSSAQIRLAGMAISFVNVESVFAVGTSVTVNVPTGTTNGDVLVATLFCWVTPNTPSGLTLVHARDWTPPDGYTRHMRIYLRVANNEPTSYTFTTSEPEELLGSISVWRGVNNTTPIDVDVVSAHSSSKVTEIVAPSFTTVTDGCEILMIATVMDDSAGGVPITPPSGYTERLDHGQSWARSFIAQRPQTTAGNVNAATATINTSQYCAAAHLALRDASAGEPFRFHRRIAHPVYRM